jgi:hypothetical protein
LTSGKMSDADSKQRDPQITQITQIKSVQSA